MLGAIEIKPLLVVNIILTIIVLWMIGNWAYYKIQQKRLGTGLDSDEFEKTMRKAQILDLREKKDFDAKHILGARNMPYTTYKTWETEIRKDLPVYLYSSGVGVSVRCALKMRKAGFSDVHWLNKGFEDWNGKTKSRVSRD